MFPFQIRFMLPGSRHACTKPLITAVCPPLLVAFLFLAWATGCGDSPDSSSPITTAPADARVVFIAADGRKAELKVEVARTESERASGLMKRDKLAADSGMIFVWDGPTQGGFWMKDTYIPLSIAFISEDGAILDIQDMQPLDLANHVPSAPYIYTVEANQGWFAQHGIRVGDRAEFLEG
ncbi:MAG: DUF192 domain-containing protein [Thermoleophilia bacterium]